MQTDVLVARVVRLTGVVKHVVSQEMDGVRD